VSKQPESPKVEIDLNLGKEQDSESGGEKKSKTTLTTNQSKKLLSFSSNSKDSQNKMSFVHLERLPKKPKAKLQWLLRRRNALPHESVRKAFRHHSVTAQLGRDMSLQMFRHQSNANALCQYLELAEALVFIPQSIAGHYKLLQDLALPATVGLLYATLLATHLPYHPALRQYYKVQRLALSILSTFYHHPPILQRTLFSMTDTGLQAIAPIVRVLDLYPHDASVQRLGIKILYQYVIVRPICGVTRALVTTPKCLEVMAAANHCLHQKEDKFVQQIIVQTNQKIFRHMMLDTQTALLEHNMAVRDKVGHAGKNAIENKKESSMKRQPLEKKQLLATKERQALEKVEALAEHPTEICFSSANGFPLLARNIDRGSISTFSSTTTSLQTNAAGSGNLYDEEFGCEVYNEI